MQRREEKRQDTRKDHWPVHDPWGSLKRQEASRLRRHLLPVCWSGEPENPVALNESQPGAACILSFVGQKNPHRGRGRVSCLVGGRAMRWDRAVTSWGSRLASNDPGERRKRFSVVVFPLTVFPGQTPAKGGPDAWLRGSGSSAFQSPP